MLFIMKFKQRRDHSIIGLSCNASEDYIYTGSGGDNCIQYTQKSHFLGARVIVQWIWCLPCILLTLSSIPTILYVSPNPAGSNSWIKARNPWHCLVWPPNKKKKGFFFTWIFKLLVSKTTIWRCQLLLNKRDKMGWDKLSNELKTEL